MIIGICGYKGSGKSTLADYLVYTYGFRRISMATPVKDMLRTFGFSEEQLYGDEKETLDPAFGVTPRWAMQSLGTEWGRNLIGPNVWTDAWWRKVTKEAKHGYTRIVVDDVRFQNEFDVIHREGGTVIQVFRTGCSPNIEGTDIHSSEKIPFEPDGAVFNDGSVEDLHEGFDTLVSMLGIL